MIPMALGGDPEKPKINIQVWNYLTLSNTLKNMTFPFISASKVTYRNITIVTNTSQRYLKQLITLSTFHVDLNITVFRGGK